ncbi:ead/Ea22-like family protein [Klebsiella pasteurii]|uniref:ead/Ea22-like family protein n=1 Tax=Klebsiella pasteurii TaxID=2587529 RepID=UPI00287C2A78|nr:ead/Ea22-like family protein [Klebsiella pasteurii]MDS7874704.1 ead/Ea22-like family protein [Klebsiella pasteurii]
MNTNELLIANGQQTADLLRHLADNEIDSDYFAVVSECESYGQETEAELSITEFALRAAGYVDELVEALEKSRAQSSKWLEAYHKVVSIGARYEERISELEEAEQKLCAANVTLDARAELAERQLAEMGSRSFTTAATDVLAERQRQITAEGWTPEHDDEYQHCEMAVSAACYIMADDDPRADVPELWPWPSEWWKPKDVRRDLVKAGALILAEIERLDRAAGIKWEAE